MLAVMLHKAQSAVRWDSCIKEDIYAFPGVPFPSLPFPVLYSVLCYAGQHCVRAVLLYAVLFHADAPRSFKEGRVCLWLKQSVCFCEPLGSTHPLHHLHI